MRIALNATSLLSPLTGIGHYCRELACGMLRRPDIDVDFFYGAAWSKAVRDAPLPGAGKVLPWLRSHLPHSYALRRAIQSNRFARHATPGRFDLYHEPNILPLPFDGPTILTVHDVSWIRHPAAHPVERVRAMDRYFPAAIAKARQIITDSHFVKQELTDLFGLPVDRVDVVPLGVDPLFRPLDVPQTHRLLAPMGLVHSRYFLLVGTLEPRKNLQTALDAFMLLPEPLRKQYPLVIAGMSGWNNSALMQRISAMESSGEVRRLGYLSRVDLACVLAGATALLFPSIYEGFGLPPLEAMACGVPVVASNAASIPEVVGECGLLHDPFDADAMARAMRSLLDDSSMRCNLAEMGLKQSAGFTWDACIKGTVRVYEKVLGLSRATAPGR